MNEAMAYAEEHWPEELILDDWASFQTVRLADPTDLARGVLGSAVPRTKFVISIGLDCKLAELSNKRDERNVELWDDAIVITSVDPLVSAELRGGRSPRNEYNCAYCGGGLGFTSCTACHLSYSDDSSRSSCVTPLPPKLIKLLRDNGHHFGLNPERLLLPSTNPTAS
jgi:hypothetical protein